MGLTRHLDDFGCATRRGSREPNSGGESWKGKSEWE